MSISNLIFGSFAYLRQTGLKGIYWYYPHPKASIRIIPDPILKFIYSSPLASKGANDND